MSSARDRHLRGKGTSEPQPGPLPAVRREGTQPVLVAIADLHLSHRPPLFRSSEPDWYVTQVGYLQQVHKIACEYGGGEPLPVVIGGDLFDDGWRPHRCPPSLINLALAYLPDNVHAIPGQHDLPHHRLANIENSAYWTLVEAGKINDLHHSGPVELPTGVRLWGFPWGVDVTPNPDPKDLLLEIAVIHDYCWAGGDTGYDGASEEKLLKNWRMKKLIEYDLAIFGDNHIAFHTTKEGVVRVVNCGSLMILKSDQRDYEPSAWVIYSDGAVERVPLDTSRDVYLEMGELEETLSKIGVATFIEELLSLGRGALDFADAVKRLLEREKVDPAVKDIILKALGEQP